MKRVLAHTPPWIVVPISVLGASLLLALVQWGPDRDGSRFTSSPTRRAAASSTPPVAKHEPVAVSGDPLPHLLTRMEGDLAESAKASDHLPMYGGADSPQCLASSDAVSVLASADRPGLPVNTGWLPTNLNGPVPARPVPLLPIAGQIPRPRVAAPAPRYGSNASPSGLIDSLFQPPVMEPALARPSTQSPPLSAGPLPAARPGTPWQAGPQAPVPLPPVWETLDAVRALPPVEPDLPGEVEAPLIVVAGDPSNSETYATEHVLLPLPPVGLRLHGPSESVAIAMIGSLFVPIADELGDDSEIGIGQNAGNGCVREVVEEETSAAVDDEDEEVPQPLPPVEESLELAEVNDAVDDEEASQPLPPVEENLELADVNEAADDEEVPQPLPPVEENLELAEVNEAVDDEEASQPLPPVEENLELADVNGAADDEEAPQPLPPVEKKLELAEANETESESFDPTGYERSWDLELIAQEADKHTRRGFELAGKKAHFSARLEFTRALRIIAQGLDTQRKTHRHSQALAGGLRALAEAEDFLAKDGHLEAELALAVIAGAHRTPVLRESDPDKLTPLAALQMYHTFAQEQMATAVGKEMAGSMALYGLGKLHVAIGQQQRGDGITSARSKAMVLLQAALIASPVNHMASNELGVLLARNGRQSEARNAFEHSVATCPTAEGWRNLALTCEQLGEMDSAYRAARETLALRGKPNGAALSVTSSNHGAVQWVSPAELVNRGGRLRTASTARARDAR